MTAAACIVLGFVLGIVCTTWLWKWEVRKLEDELIETGRDRDAAWRTFAAEHRLRGRVEQERDGTLARNVRQAEELDQLRREAANHVQAIELVLDDAEPLEGGVG